MSGTSQTYKRGSLQIYILGRLTKGDLYRSIFSADLQEGIFADLCSRQTYKKGSLQIYILGRLTRGDLYRSTFPADFQEGIFADLYSRQTYKRGSLQIYILGRLTRGDLCRCIFSAEGPFSASEVPTTCTEPRLRRVLRPLLHVYGEFSVPSYTSTASAQTPTIPNG